MQTAIRALVVEDSKTRAYFYQVTLETLGCDVTVCNDAETALRVYDAESYGLAIVDWVLPGIDGLEFCRRMRALDPEKLTYVLMATARKTTEDLDAVLEAGADDFIATPLDKHVLKARLRIVLRNARSRVKRRQAEALLKKNYDVTRRIIDAIPYPTMIIKYPERTILGTNTIARNAGVGEGGRCFEDFGKSRYVPEGSGMCFFCRAEEMHRTGNNIETRELYAYDKWWIVYWVPLGDDMFMHFYIDITDMKTAREQAEKSLREKEVLLREVHHRVKNNLAIISSLLDLQSRYLSDEAARAMFAESKSRINTMALIHKKLYESKDLSEINAVEYLRSLAVMLHTAQGQVSSEVDLSVEIDSPPLDIDCLIPLGLILNELLTNAYKYAFKGVEPARLGVTLKYADHDWLRLEIRDNGVGLPVGFDIDNTHSLGMRLVRSLTEQIDGTLELWSAPGEGARFTITFKGPIGA